MRCLSAFPLGLGQRGDDVGEGGEVDAPAGFDGLDRERGGQMAFAGAGRTEEMHHFGAVDELEFGEHQDAFRSSEGWKAKSKPASVLMVVRRAMGAPS